MKDQLIIFDTTLRDGEQSPGASMTREEKVRIARQLESMRVDVIEAGFPAASPGDFEAVQAVAEAIKDSTVCALARALERDIDARRRGDQAGQVGAHPHLHRHQPDPHGEEAAHEPDQVVEQAVQGGEDGRASTPTTWSSPPRMRGARRWISCAASSRR